MSWTLWTCLKSFLSWEVQKGPQKQLLEPNNYVTAPHMVLPQEVLPHMLVSSDAEYTVEEKNVRVPKPPPSINVWEEMLQTNEITKVIVSSAIKVFWRTSTGYHVHLRKGNPKKLLFKFENGVLKIGLKSGTYKKVPELEISAPISLKSLHLKGGVFFNIDNLSLKGSLELEGSSVFICSKISGLTLLVKMSGSSTANIDKLRAVNLDIELKGSSTLNVKDGEPTYLTRVTVFQKGATYAWIDCIKPEKLIVDLKGTAFLSSGINGILLGKLKHCSSLKLCGEMKQKHLTKARTTTIEYWWAEC